MNHSEQMNELAVALAAAQSNMKAPKKDREVEVATRAGSKYKFRYATFDAIVESVRGPLTTAGIAFLQSAELDESNVTVETMLLHKSGQWISSTIGAHLDPGAGPQGLGSLISYLKRYALSAILGVVADEDDDGNAASGNEATVQGRKAPKPPAPAPTTASADMWASMEKHLSDAGVHVVTDPNSTHRSAYISWLRGAYQQALGRDISKLGVLTPAECQSGCLKIVGMLRDKSIKPFEVPNA